MCGDRWTVVLGIRGCKNHQLLRLFTSHTQQIYPPLAVKDNNKMAKKVALIHPQTGLMKSGYYGFSWTFLFFGWFVPVFRGELFVALLHLTITVVTFGIWQVIIAFLYNKQYMTRMLEKGYVFNDTEQVNEEARRKIGVAKL